MADSVARLVTRAMRAAFVATCLFNLGSCSRESAPSQPPAQTPSVSKPTVVPPAAITPLTAPAPTAAAEAANDEAKILCETYVAALSGHGKDPQLLKDPNVQALARRVPDLVSCTAVATKSDAVCETLGEGEQGKECSDRRSIFNELGRYPKGRGFIFPDRDYEQCRSEKVMAAYCDAIRVAARAGDASKCPAGRLQGFCRAFIALDKSMCEGLGPQRDCEMQIDRKLVFASGVNELAESGPQPIRALARASLGQADACAAFARSALEACIAGVPDPVPPSAPAETVPPTAPAANADNTAGT